LVICLRLFLLKIVCVDQLLWFSDAEPSCFNNYGVVDFEVELAFEALQLEMHSASTEEVERNYHFPAHGRNCMTHRQALTAVAAKNNSHNSAAVSTIVLRASYCCARGYGSIYC
jgi:hypothetical protein